MRKIGLLDILKNQHIDLLFSTASSLATPSIRHGGPAPEPLLSSLPSCRFHHNQSQKRKYKFTFVVAEALASPPLPSSSHLQVPVITLAGARETFGAACLSRVLNAAALV